MTWLAVRFYSNTIFFTFIPNIIADPIENPNMGNEKCNKIELPMTSINVTNENYSLYNFSVRFFNFSTSQLSFNHKKNYDGGGLDRQLVKTITL